MFTNEFLLLHENPLETKGKKTKEVNEASTAIEIAEVVTAKLIESIKDQLKKRESEPHE